jgi:hypothetical protein
MRFRVPSFLYLLSLLMIGCGPIVMVAGGSLSGEITPVPTDWAFTNEVEVVQLETRPTDPYSVNIWLIEVEGAIYIVAGGGPETTWAQHIEEDPRVRLRVNDALYELRAVESNDATHRDLFLEAAKAKYDFDPDDEDTSKAVLYRLEPRRASAT